ncbi:MAG: penicillin-binding protein 2 [Verrucomicrobiae bacterium]|nr:penicillin-binding protein 2 [Verrucomicrobiae bacterium]
MTNKLQIRRALLLLTCLVALFAGLGYRLVDLQVIRHDELLKQAEKKTERRISETAKRGDILDVNGNLLATSVPVRTVWANPELLAGQHVLPNAPAVFARTLAPWLKADEGRLYQQMLPRTHVNLRGETVTNQYAVLKRQVSEDNWRQIQAVLRDMTGMVDTRAWKKSDRMALTNLCLNAVATDADQMRVYPNGTNAAQVVGFVSAAVATNFPAGLVGCDGIEKSFNSKLSGVDGWRVTEADSARRELASHRDEDVPARDGLNVVLTLDVAVQHILETALAEGMQKHSPKSITGIVMRPRTGEILGMASLPDYDPNIPNTISTNGRNRVINDVVEPGSTFKIVVVSGALNNGIVSLNDEFFCENGRFAFAGRVLHDHESLGNESVKSIIMKSSNIGAAKIGIKLGEQSLYDYAWNYGFGQRTGVPLPGEAGGILYPVKKWSKVSIAQIPMGHGVAVTRLQMIMAMSAIANDGWLMRPMLVSRLQQRDGGVVQRYAPERVRQVVTEATTKKMIEALKGVATKEGTAVEAAMKNYVVAGKTGTAQKVENGAYVSGKYISSFIGFFPADNPELCISIVMDEPKEYGYYGGKVCGPVFREVAERCASYLNIPPDPTLMATNTLVVQNNFRVAGNP